MRAGLKFSRHCASMLLLVGVVLGGCAGVATPPALSLQQRIEAARSRADHQALESYFAGEAVQARARAEEHRNMAQAYVRQVAAGRANANMSTDCHMLIDGYESMAAQYELMAANHHQLAEQAK